MKTTEKLQGVCCGSGVWGGGGGGGGACTCVHFSFIHFEISNRMKHQAIRTGRYNSVLCWAGRGWSQRNRCVDNYWGVGGGQHFGTSKVSRAPWWSVSTVWLSNAKASGDTGNHTQFSKAKGRVQRSTAHGQAVWVLCEVNVHIHIMYRHHLHSWVSGFSKSPW